MGLTVLLHMLWFFRRFLLLIKHVSPIFTLLEVLEPVVEIVSEPLVNV